MNNFSGEKICIVILAVFILAFGHLISFGADFSFCAEFECPSSFNPVGSGARAIGRGGAFIAVADDATAASWNPGGLTQLKKPETSVVFSGFNRKEDIDFGTNPEANGLHSISETNINYLSATYPFELFNRNMVVSLSYQHLYDFTRDWSFLLKQQSSEDYWSYQQDGTLSALGLSYCIRIIPQLSLGFTLNFWNDNLTPNQWEQKYDLSGSGSLGSVAYTENLYKTETYFFNGFNINFGMLWQIDYRLTLGAVLKTPFNADIEHKVKTDWTMISDTLVTIHPDYTMYEELKMPMSYGIGFAYNFSDNLSVAGDIYKTEWNHCIYKKENGKEVSPFGTSDISSTYQVRIGGEYLFFDKEKGYIIPIRAGIFYDPAPASGSPDNFYGFSIGTGFTKNERFSVDIAYQYRFGNDVGKSLLPHFQFSQSVNEHTLYVSAIFYKF